MMASPLFVRGYAVSIISKQLNIKITRTRRCTRALPTDLLNIGEQIFAFSII